MSSNLLRAFGQSHKCGACQGCPHLDGRTPTGLRGVSPVVWALGVTSMLTDVASEMVSSVLPLYLVLYLRMSPVSFGIIDGLYQGAAVLFRVAGGFAGDRSQRHKNVAVVGYGLSALSRAALLAAGNAWGALAAIVAIDRWGKGIRTGPRDAIITASSPCRGLAQAFGVHRALDAAGAMLGPLAAFLVLAWIPNGFDVIFIVSFAFAVLGVAVLVLFVPSPRPTLRMKGEAPITMRDAIAVFGEVRFTRLTVAAGLLSIATTSDAFIFMALQRQHAFNAGYFPLLFVGVSLVNFLFAIPGGQAADRMGRTGVFLSGYAMLALVYGAVLLPASAPVAIVAAIVLLGGYYAMTDGVLTAMAGAMLPARVRASGLSLLATATNGGRFLASVVFGALWNWFGLQIALLAFAAAAVIAIAAAAMLLRPPAQGRNAYAPAA